MIDFAQIMREMKVAAKYVKAADFNGDGMISAREAKKAATMHPDKIPSFSKMKAHARMYEPEIFAKKTRDGKLSYPIINRDDQRPAHLQARLHNDATMQRDILPVVDKQLASHGTLPDKGWVDLWGPNPDSAA